MQKIILGRTGLEVTRSGYGALPLQRIPIAEAVALLRQARDGGINFFDTARAYSDSEIKLGEAFGGAWQDIIIATKTQAKDAATLKRDLEISLGNLKCDCIDIYQLHNMQFVPAQDHELYQALLEAQSTGKIRFIGLTTHKLDIAKEAVESGLYDTIQYPLSCLSDDEELEMAERCQELNIGVIAMKAMAGGLLPSASLSMAYLRHLENVVPIWGMQFAHEVEEVLALEKTPPVLANDPELKARIDEQRQTLTGNFCRGCGYCLPCPANIQLNTIVRLPQLLRRSPWKERYSENFRAEMAKIEQCIHCGACKTRCPYGLDAEVMIVEALEDWKAFGREQGIEI